MRSLTRRVTFLAIALIATACSGPPGQGGVAPAGSAADPTAAPADAWLVLGRAGQPGLQVLLASTREELYQLPDGVPDGSWGQILAVTPSATTTLVEDLVVQPGFGGPRQTIDGAWRLPTVGLDPLPVGVSADGSTIALVEAGPQPAWGEATTSRFAILDRSLDADPRIIELAGAFEFDALSPDGTRLYVAEHIAGPLADRYQVRVVDTGTGVMGDAIIVDKRNLDEVMAGRPVDQLRRIDGVVLTLYRGTEHPFVHALNTAEAWAVCIDLPATGLEDDGAATDWGIVTTPDGRAELAVNATLGLIVDIHPTDLTVRRTVELERTARGIVTLAKFGHQPVGPAGRRVIAAPDGSAVYAAGRDGIMRIATDGLTVEQRALPAVQVDAMALTPDGATLFALVREDGGGIARIDAATGTVLDWVAGDGYDRLVAVVPW
jgi:DNA-binding beta-propeller fold protein YncE